ncbi:MAG: ATP-binding protein [Burkholderiales bacterium]|nr:ATP-binding protein [Burkholderiales bacterium]
MRLKSVCIESLNGIDKVEIGDLADVVVFAGPNGVGKTRILRALVDFFRKPRAGNVRILVEATSDAEAMTFGKPQLDTGIPSDTEKLRGLLTKSQRRNRYRSTVLNFESDRSIVQIQPFNFSWDFNDPFEEDVGWDQTYTFLRDRFSDVQHSLFKLVENQRRKLADKAFQMQANGLPNMPLDFPDPLERFKDAFFQLLGPKRLVEANLRQQSLIYELDGERRPLETLSSGEREVVNIVFDFLLRNPSDCIVFFDEPELHLHPELSYKLLQTLSGIGKNNQFLFCTHSPEIITASIDNTVVFVTPKKSDHSNQAIIVGRDDATHHALKLLGQSIGIISLGKKLLLIEGDESSLDKQTYGAILKTDYPEFVLVPVGGKGTIRSLEDIRESVLNRTIWGVEFYMLCDRDAAHGMGLQSLAAQPTDRLKMLPRYHLENYFLDEIVLAHLFSRMERDPESWLRTPDKIRSVLRELAKDTIPVATALHVAAAVRETTGNVDIKPKQCGSSIETLVEAFKVRVQTERQRVQDNLDMEMIEALCRSEYERLYQAVHDDSPNWLTDIPGRIVLNKFAAKANLQPGRLKTLYIQSTNEAGRDPFAEIRTLLDSFRESAANSSVIATVA